MDDKTLAQKRADLRDKLNLIREKETELTELTEEAGDLAEEINAEEERRKDFPGGEVRNFRPRPSNGPADQGSC